MPVDHHLADLFLDICLVDHQLGLKTVESIRYEIMSLGKLGLYPGHQTGDLVRGMAMVRGNKAMNNALQRLIFEFPIFGLRSEQPRQSPIELQLGIIIRHILLRYECRRIQHHLRCRRPITRLVTLQCTYRLVQPAHEEIESHCMGVPRLLGP